MNSNRPKGNLSATRPIQRVLIIGDEPLYRLGVKLVLNEVCSSLPVAEFDSRTALNGTTQQDLVIICQRGRQAKDCSLAPVLEALASKSTPVILFTSVFGKRHRSYIESDRVESCLPMSIGFKDAFKALSAYIGQNQTNTNSNNSTANLQQQFNPDLADISERERQVLYCLAEGNSNRSIANQLKISINTVKFYLVKICKELCFRNRTHAACYVNSISHI